MNFKQNAIGAIAMLALLSACASSTPYQSAEDSRWGFSEQQIEGDRFRISFGGNAITDRETVESYLLYRAAELTLEQGYDYFLMVTRATDEETNSYRSGFNPHYSFYRPRWGWRGHHDPFWNDIPMRERTRYEASAEILLARGTKPSDANAFDARDVIANLGDQITRPSSD